MPLQPSDVPSRSGIQAAINEAVDDHASTIDPLSQHYDTGWQPIPPRAGYQTSGETPQYRRIGEIVLVRGRVQPNPAGNFTADATVIVADLPAGARPGALTMWPVAGSTAATSGGRFWFATNGSINVNPDFAPSNVSIAASFAI